MTTTMSFSKLSDAKKSQFGFLYKFALKKTAGWTAIYTILAFLAFPLVTFQECITMASRYGMVYIEQVHYSMGFQTMCSGLVSALMCGMVLVYSAVLYSYMHGRRSADFYHSLPVDRTVMLLANFSAALTNLVVPLWITSILSAVAYPVILTGVDFTFMWKILGLQAVAWTMGAFILLAISTMVAVSVATAVENVGYTVALLLEGSILLLLWDLAGNAVFETYISIFSSSGSIDNILTDLIYYFSPVFALGQVILQLVNGVGYFFGDIMPSDIIDVWSRVNWLPLIVWFVLGIGALWLAVRIYNKRQSEKAEQWGRQSWLGFAVKLMSAVIGAWIFGGIFGSGLLSLDSRYIFTFGALTGAPITYLLIEAVTNKGFTNMKKCLPYMCTAVAVIFVGSLYFLADGFGYDERIPEVENVKTVELEIMNIDEAVKWSDDYAMTYSRELEKEKGSPYEIDGYKTDIILEEPETIELVTKLHRNGLLDGHDYLGALTVNYNKGLIDIRRRVNLYDNVVDDLLELLYSDEYLEKHDPIFEMKGSHLEFVQISDKMGNPLNDGEIPAEYFDELISALKEDRKNATPEALRDSSNNKEVAILQILTKYPNEIYEATGELYHYNMQQSVAVRAMDVNTVKLLESLGYDFEIKESFYESVIGISVQRAYASSRTNLMYASNGADTYAVYEDYELMGKYDFDGQEFIKDEKWIKTLIEEGTGVYNNYGDQYGIEIFQKMGNSVYGSNLYIDRAIIAEMMVETNNFIAPYILSDAEMALLRKDIASESEGALMEESANWYQYLEGKDALEENLSMLDYCKDKYPEILDGKSEAELLCMSKTPLYGMKYGNLIHIYW